MTLFFVLTPGVLLTLPRKGSVYLVALVHAAVFGLVYKLTHKMVYRYFTEGFEGESCTNDVECNRPINNDKTQMPPRQMITPTARCIKGTCKRMIAGFVDGNTCTYDSDCNSNRPIYCDKNNPSCDINVQYVCNKGTCVKTDGRG